MSAIALGRFLARRMAAEGVDPAEPLTVEDVRKRLVPYRSCRGRLDLATKAEYDLALLALLSEPELIEVMDEGVRAAVQRELASPEPELAVLDGFAASRLQLGPALGGPRRAKSAAGAEKAAKKASTPRPGPEPAEEPAEEEVEEAVGACRACGAELPRAREVRFCPYCGADQERPRCAACGEELEAEWRYCPACGRAVDT